MAREHIGADWIFNETMKQIAPLPCQEEYLRQLADIMSFHLHRNELMDTGIKAEELPAPSALVVAPTGQGKTFLLRKMSEVANINVIVVDGSTLAAEGWKGVALGQRLLAAKEQIPNGRHFARSILFIDEIDKMRFWGTNQDQANPTHNLLQLYNGGHYVTEDSNKNTVSIPVDRFTVLLGGAFSGLEDIIRERVAPKGRAGFLESEGRVKRSTAELLEMVTLEDLKKFGVSAELLGRIGSILTIPPLTLEDYKQLLRASAGSAQAKYDKYLKKLYGVNFTISDAGAHTLAQRCMQLNTGARAVNPIINDLMRNSIAEVERNQQIHKVILDAEGDQHVIRYENGLRDHSLYNPKMTNAKPAEDGKMLICKIKADHVPALTNKLCRYFKNAGGETGWIPELEAFLNCALLYMYQYAPKTDFTFDHLLLLARLVNRKGQKQSHFEEVVGAKMADDDTYKTLMVCYHPELHHNLVQDLILIHQYMIEKNGKAAFWFEVKHQARNVQ